jgi:hypothetical protein
MLQFSFRKQASALDEGKQFLHEKMIAKYIIKYLAIITIKL